MTIVSEDLQGMRELTKSTKKRSSELKLPSKLSVLQKKLLKNALMAHCRTPLDLADRNEDPGCFTVRTVGRAPPDPEIFSLRWKKANKEERRKNASLRAAAGLSVRRLVTRGLVERCSRGKWRLTAKGVAVAQQFYPEIQPMSKEEVARTIAFREALHAAKPGLRRRRKRPKAPPKHATITTITTPVREPVPTSEIEIEMDY
jgi:hypothetical protein